MKGGKNGAPFKYNTDKQILDIADVFFANCDAKSEPYTITGLALALDTDRKTLMAWENSDRLCNTIKKIKSKVEEYVERRVAMGKIPPAVGIFMLKNFGWTDKQEIDQNIKGDISLSQILIEAKNKKLLDSGEEEG